MAILLAYEDEYFQELDRAVRRVLRDRYGKLTSRREAYTVKGNGRFKPFIAKEWPIFRDVGYPTKNKGPMRTLVCVIEADRLPEWLQTATPAPAGGTEEWVIEVEAQLQEHLRQEAPGGGAEVFVSVIRWSYESLVVAAHDQRTAFSALSGARPWDDRQVDGYLARCMPDPRLIEDSAFVDTFRHPQRCLRDLSRELTIRQIQKGDIRKDSVVRKFSERAPDRLQVRVPDLARLADRVYELSSGSALTQDYSPT